MHRGLFLSVFLLYSITAVCKGKPKIVSQKNLQTEQGQSITIQLSFLEVVDENGNPYPNYPDGFQLEVFKGDNYKVSNNTVTPDGSFFGTLTVPVKVSQGKDKSDKFDLKIFVSERQNTNVPPVIISQLPLKVQQDKSLTIKLTDLVVNDPDDSYPNGFSLKILPGENYVVSGNTIQPATGFSGTLAVPVVVNDGTDDSTPFTLSITVETKRKNIAPVITGQSGLSTVKNVALTISLKNLIVTDPDNKYPDDFILNILPGENYVVSENQIIPRAEFTGTLSVNVTVSDGTGLSNIFPLTVTVVNIADLQIIGQNELQISEDSSLELKLGDLRVNDPEQKFPGGFQLQIEAGEHFSVSGNTITPEKNFAGNLEIPVRVSNGARVSSPFNVLVRVTPVNDPPLISGLSTTPLTYQLTDNPVFIAKDLTIEDPDDNLLSMAEIGFETGYYQPDGDALIPTFSSPSIRAVFDNGSGILFLIGEAPVADYVQVLQSLTYQFSATDTLQPQSSKHIYFAVSDGSDLSDRQIVTVQFTEELTLDIPTVFTPNNDNANDTWRVKLQQGGQINGELQIRVYSTHGSLVYESSSLDEEWDGTLNGRLLPADNYFFLIELNQPLSQKVYQGSVTILH
jgi:gliding motility-associated-like protein